MTLFDQRERAFEAKFAHDQDLKFRVAARRDKLFAHWMAGRIGLTAGETDALVAEVLHVPDTAGHIGTLIARAGALLMEHGLTVTDAELSDALHHCQDEAAAQLSAAVAQQPDAG